MGDPLNLGMSNLKLKNGKTLEDLISGSEIELQKEDILYDTPEDHRLNKEEFDRIYNSNVDEEEVDQIDLTGTSFEEMARNMRDISDDGGILKKLMKRGYGPLVAQDSIIYVHYNAYSEYSDAPFDSSHLRKQSFKYRMGSDRGILGWELSLLTMSKGEKARFLIRSDYGFRDMGCPPRVPQNATALFIIEVLNIFDKGGIDDLYLLNEDERQNIGFEQVNKLVHAEKRQATQFFSQKMFKKAFNKYKQATHLLETCHLKSDEEETESQRLLVSLNLNMTLCCLRLAHSGQAITYSRKVLNMDRNNVKALFRLGQALHQLRQFDEAKKYLYKAKRFLPDDSSIQRELRLVEEDEEKFKFLEAGLYKRMSAGIETEKKDLPPPTPVTPEPEEKVNTQTDAVSKGFQDSITKYLQGFVDDKCQDACLLPSSLSVEEMDFVVEMVNSMELYIVQTGSGQHSYIQITKTALQLKDDQVLLS